MKHGMSALPTLGHTSRKRAATIPSALFPGALLGALLVLSVGCGEQDLSPPTYTVEDRDFHHRVTAEGRLQAVHSTPLQVPSETRSRVRLAWLAPEGTRLSEGDAVAIFDGKETEEKLEDSKISFAGNSLQLEKSQIHNDMELGRLNKDLKKAEIDLAHSEKFKRQDAEVFSRRSILEDSIDGQLALERREHAESSADTRRSLAQTEQDLLSIKRRQVEQQIEQAEAGLQAMKIVAPHDGVLTLERNWRGDKPNVGMDLWPGQPIGSIPDLKEMEAKVYVLEADAGGLVEGKRAGVIVDSSPGKVFPATIQSVEAVAQPRFRGSPVQYFGVVLTFEATDVDVMKPGGRVTAVLHLAEKENALVVPRQAVFHGLTPTEAPSSDSSAGSDDEGTAQNASSVEGTEVEVATLGAEGQADKAQVFVRVGDSFEIREVLVGAGSLSEAVILDGLQAGDVVALAEPWSRTGSEDSAQGGGGGAAALGGS